MHETVIASSLLKIAVDEMEKNVRSAGFKEILPDKMSIDRIAVKAGLLNCLEVQTLKACFELLSEETCAKNANLQVDILPLKGRCPSCSMSVETAIKKFSCPNCGNDSVEWDNGNELYIDHIEVTF